MVDDNGLLALTNNNEVAKVYERDDGLIVVLLRLLVGREEKGRRELGESISR